MCVRIHVTALAQLHTVVPRIDNAFGLNDSVLAALSNNITVDKSTSLNGASAADKMAEARANNKLDD
jgi:hypothetical protein